MRSLARPAAAALDSGLRRNDRIALMRAWRGPPRLPWIPAFAGIVHVPRGHHKG
ncbi:MAG: hypothetical protein Q7R39_06945 [Dehalococcoidia bacterium]|nr:hypothetical protein [Dehalococcoidia bacterium]